LTVAGGSSRCRALLYCAQFRRAMSMLWTKGADAPSNWALNWSYAFQSTRRRGMLTGHLLSTTPRFATADTGLPDPEDLTPRRCPRCTFLPLLIALRLLQIDFRSLLNPAADQRARRSLFFAGPRLPPQPQPQREPYANLDGRLRKHHVSGLLGVAKKTGRTLPACRNSAAGRGSGAPLTGSVRAHESG
jgi:hypothetical protein